jgi:hypothetical protein
MAVFCVAVPCSLTEVSRRFVGAFYLHQQGSGRGEKLLQNFGWKTRKKYIFCYRHEDNRKIDFKEMGWEAVEWIHVVQNR